MDNNWFVNISGINYGPYSLLDLRAMINRGEIQSDALIYNQSIGRWTPAYQVDQLMLHGVTSGHQTQYQGVSAQPLSPYSNKPKKKHGCLKGCLISVLAVVLVIAGFIIFWPDGPRNLELARGETIEKASIDAKGGVIDAGEIIIDVPKNAFEKKTKFKVQTKEIKEHHFGNAFNPITPVFSIDNNNKKSAEPMKVTIPIFPAMKICPYL